VQRPAWEIGQLFVFNDINAHGVDIEMEAVADFVEDALHRSE